MKFGWLKFKRKEKEVKIMQEVYGEGLEGLIGSKVTLFCANYFYTGKLVGVNKTFVKLEDPAIVYETGAFTDAQYKDEQKLNVKYWYVRVPAIESFGVNK